MSGRRGPKPKPDAIKAQRKPVQSKREKPTPAQAAQAAEPIPDVGPAAEAQTGGAISPPVWLEGEGLKVWERLSPRLIQLRLLQVADVETFARYCRNFARWLKLQAAMDSDGEVYETTSKHMEGTLRRINPAFMVSDRLERMLLATEDRFGLNPAERQRLFQSRANKVPTPGELPFDQGAPAKRDGDAAASAAPAAEPATDSPVGFLH